MTEINEFSTEDLVEYLLRHADPEREVHGKLLKIRDCLRRNVMLGPSARRFLDRLYERLEDNIECRGMDSRGLCLLIPRKGNCDHTDRFRRCASYEPARPLRRGERPM